MIVFIKKNKFIKNPDIEEEYYLNNGFTRVELDKIYADCVYDDFNDDFTFNVEKYNARKQKENKVNCKREIEKLIALKYDIRDELAIQRQKNIKPEEYEEYYNYVEQCKKEVKEKYGY